MSKGSVGDPDLVAQAVAGDREAARELVQRHQNKVYRLALRITRNPSDAQDVLQETFLNVFRKLDSFQGASAFTSWLYRVTVNTALMRLRSDRKVDEIPLDTVLPTFSDSGEFAGKIADWSERGDARVERREIAATIQAAVEALPEKYRIVFLLRDVEDLSTEEVADVLDLSVPAVKTRLHRARLFLRKAISEQMAGGPRGEPDTSASPAASGPPT